MWIFRRIGVCYCHTLVKILTRISSCMLCNLNLKSFFLVILPRKRLLPFLFGKSLLWLKLVISSNKITDLPSLWLFRNPSIFLHFLLHRIIGCLLKEIIQFLKLHNLKFLLNLFWLGLSVVLVISLYYLRLKDVHDFVLYLFILWLDHFWVCMYIITSLEIDSSLLPPQWCHSLDLTFCGMFMVLWLMTVTWRFVRTTRKAAFPLLPLQQFQNILTQYLHIFIFCLGLSGGHALSLLWCP